MRKEEKTLSTLSISRQRNYNWGDWMLYEFFQKKLHREVVQIGLKKVEYYKNKIIARSQQISDECIQQNVSQTCLKNIFYAKKHCTPNFLVVF